MAQTAKAKQNSLTLTPKAMQKALAESADQARRLADAYGAVVPGVKPKAIKGASVASTSR